MQGYKITISGVHLPVYYTIFFKDIESNSVVQQQGWVPTKKKIVLMGEKEMQKSAAS